MTYNFNTAAKLLGIGQNKLTKQLRTNGVLLANNIPKQKFINSGYFAVKHKSYPHPVCGLTHYGKTFVTAKGLNWIAKQLNLNAACQADARPTTKASQPNL